jgi:hypothetical protein
MATDNESFNRDLYDLLKVRGYQPVPLDSKNQRVPASQAADVIQFTFTKDGEEYGKAWVSIDDAQNVIVYYDEEQQESPSSATPGVEYNDSWTGLLKHLKQWAQRRQLSFELSNKDRLGDDMRQRDYYKMKERVSESILKEAAPFRKGDRIEVVKGEHAGELGTVLSVDKDYEMVKVTLDKFPNGRASANYDMFKKVMKEEQLSEIGDTNAGKKALGSYVKKATSEIPDLDKERENHARSAAAGDWRRMKQIDKVGTKVDNRRQGVDRAISRLTKVDESYHPINKRTSYNDAIPSVKIILQHNRNIEEGEQRYRNVAKIYLENVDGERFLAPTTRPGIARVYARHIAEGGVPNDDKWNHIKSICEDYTKMAGFVRATRNGQFNESAQEFVAEGVNHYNSLRETLHKLAGHRGYQAYFESWTPTLMEDELDESINELFVQEMVDPRIESAMPILSRLKKPVTEMEEIDTLAEWADSVINEKLELDEEEKLDEVGSISGDFMHSMTRPVRDLAKKGGAKKALRRVVPGLGKREAGERAKDEKFHASLMKTAAPTYYDGEENPDYDMEVRSGKASEKAAKRYSNIAKGKKPFAEDGVNENLANWQMGVQSMPRTEPFKLKKIVVKDLDDPRSKTYTFDTEEEARRLFPDSWDRIKAGKTKLTVTGLDENFIGMAPQAVAEEEVEESGLQAYLGKKKYGEKGMKALQQAGRDGASKEKMASIRAKHDKLDEVDMGQADRTLRHTPRGDDNGKMSHITSLSKAAKKMGHDSYADVPDNAVEKLKTLAKKIRGGDDVSEDLDANQKRVGQLGPTEKVKNNNIGKLVGASESTEIDPELARIMEMARFKR